MSKKKDKNGDNVKKVLDHLPNTLAGLRKATRLSNSKVNGILQKLVTAHKIERIKGEKDPNTGKALARESFVYHVKK